MGKSYQYTVANKEKLDKWCKELKIDEKNFEIEEEFRNYKKCSVSINKKIKEEQSLFLQCLEKELEEEDKFNKGGWKEQLKKRWLNEIIREAFWKDDEFSYGGFVWTYFENDNLGEIIENCLIKGIDINAIEEINHEILDYCDEDLSDEELNLIGKMVIDELKSIAARHIESDVLQNRINREICSLIKKGKVASIVERWYEIVELYMNNLRKNNEVDYLAIASKYGYDLISVLTFAVDENIKYDDLQKQLKQNCFLSDFVYNELLGRIKEKILCKREFWLAFLNENVHVSRGDLDYIRKKVWKKLNIQEKSFLIGIGLNQDDFIWDWKNENDDYWTIVKEVILTKRVFINKCKFLRVSNTMNGIGTNIKNKEKISGLELQFILKYAKDKIDKIFGQYGKLDDERFWEQQLRVSIAKEALYEIIKDEKRYKEDQLKEEIDLITDYGKQREIFCIKKNHLIAAVKSIRDNEGNTKNDKAVIKRDESIKSYFSLAYELNLKYDSDKIIEKGMGKNRVYQEYYKKIKNLRLGISPMESYMLEKKTGLILATIVYMGCIDVIVNEFVDENTRYKWKPVFAKLTEMLSSIHNLDIRLQITNEVIKLVKGILKEGQNGEYVVVVEGLITYLEKKISYLNAESDLLLKYMVIAFAPNRRWKCLKRLAYAKCPGFEQGLNFLEQMEKLMKKNPETEDGRRFKELYNSSTTTNKSQYWFFSQIVDSVNKSVEVN